MPSADRLSKEEQGAQNRTPPPTAPTSTTAPGATHSASGATRTAPGATRVAHGSIVLNADRTDGERLRLVILNTGDRPVQIGSHLHLPDANSALAFDRDAAEGFRLDIPAGTSQRFEPGASREVAAVALRGRRVVPGLQVKHG